MKNEFKRSLLQILLLFSIIIYLEAIVNKLPQICLENIMKVTHLKQTGYLKNEFPAIWKICSIGASSINDWYARCTYGNRNNRGIKLSHWNAVNAHLKNKLNEIESVTGLLHPLSFGVSEANLLKKHKIEDVQIPDYELITALTMDNPKLQYSRVVVYKHTSIISKVRTDLMSQHFSSIC